LFQVKASRCACAEMWDEDSVFNTYDRAIQRQRRAIDAQSSVKQYRVFQVETIYF
jgi:hypothetical protein